MSRPVNKSDSVAVIPSGYTGASNLTAGTGSYVPANGYHDHTWTTNYARWTLGSSNTSTVCYVYYTFDTSAVPSNATITSVTATVKAYRNQRVTQGTSGVQLYAGTTAKGSAVAGTLGQTATTVNITDGGSWTRSELNNLRLRLYGVRSSTSQTGYLYLYGATVTINYTISGTEYEVTSTLATDAIDSIDPAGLTYVFGGEDYELKIYADNIDDILVEDNGTDVTSSLVYVSGINDTSTFNPSTFDSTNSSVSGTNTTNACAEETTSTTATFTASTSGTTSIYYNFDCSSIPEDVSITNVSVTLRCSWPGGNGTNNTGTTYFTSRMVYLCSGTTKKGSGATITNTTSSQTATQTVNDNGTWTREELSNIKLLLEGVHASGNTQSVTVTLWGATLSVTYELPEYYRYSLTNVNVDHTIVLSDAIIEIPEEDPQYDYYPITISSINASTDPGRGTIRVVEGTNQTITIYPADPQITLVTDNGVDITGQLVQHGGTIPTPTVSTASGASYGFTLNSSTGYYTSANKGVDKSAAVCRVDFDFPVQCLVTIQYINYAEATYDFGIFGNLDVALTNDYKPASGSMPDSNYKLACNTSSYNTSSVQTITYEVPSGEHFLNIKFSKDDATSSNNDTLQWKISSIEPLETNNYYTYTLSNIQAAHSLIFIFGDVTYYFVNSSGTGAKLFPSGSMVQLPGDYYSLTIVPDDYSYEISVLDNNADVTSQVQRKEEEITKEGNTYTVVNYIYRLSNIQATHNIVVQAKPNNPFYVRVGDSWVKATKVYIRSGNQWSEVQDYDNVIDPTQVYRKG